MSKSKYTLSVRLPKDTAARLNDIARFARTDVQTVIRVALGAELIRLGVVGTKIAKKKGRGK